MIIVEIILCLVILISLILLVILINKNKFYIYLIKINEAENNIDLFLQEKLDLLNKCRPIIGKAIKKDDFFENIKDLNKSDYTHFELYNLLRDNYNELFDILENNEKLFKKKNLDEILEELNNNEEQLLAGIKFYNDSVVGYNELIHKFPSNLIRHFFGYDEKEFYKNEKREIFEILKDIK